MNDPQQGEFRIESESDIVMARKIVRNAATALGFGITDVTRIVTAASELTRNIYQYAKCRRHALAVAEPGARRGPGTDVRGPRAGHSRRGEGDGSRASAPATGWAWACPAPNG